MNKDFLSQVPASKLKIYDFKAPKRIAKDDLKILNLATDDFSRLMTACISGLTREICSVYNPEITEMNFDDYISKLPEHSMICDFIAKSDDSSPCQVIFNLPPNLFFILMDILLGGNGKPFDPDRQHTEIEVSICRYLMLKFQTVLIDSWEAVKKIDFSFDKVEASSKNIEAKATNDAKIVMTYNVNIKNVMGDISIAYPIQFIESLLNHSNENLSQDNNIPIDNEKEAIRQKAIMSSLNDAELEITAILSQINLNMQDVLDLSVGDIIPLEKKITDDIQICIENVPWFNAKLGNSNIKKAVKITEILNDKNQF